jgi:KaiC/GvpD/RAD55 family RecA-like ATPase
MTIVLKHDNFENREKFGYLYVENMTMAPKHDNILRNEQRSKSCMTIAPKHDNFQKWEK